MSIKSHFAKAEHPLSLFLIAIAWASSIVCIVLSLCGCARTPYTTTSELSSVYALSISNSNDSSDFQVRVGPYAICARVSPEWTCFGTTGQTRDSILANFARNQSLGETQLLIENGFDLQKALSFGKSAPGGLLVFAAACLLLLYIIAEFRFRSRASISQQNQKWRSRFRQNCIKLSFAGILFIFADALSTSIAVAGIQVSSRYQVAAGSAYLMLQWLSFGLVIISTIGAYCLFKAGAMTSSAETASPTTNTDLSHDAISSLIGKQQGMQMNTDMEADW